MSTHYHVKRRFSKFLHHSVISTISQIAYLCIINSTKDAMGFNNFVALNILR